VPVGVEIGEAQLPDVGGTAEIRFRQPEALAEDIAQTAADHIVLGGHCFCESAVHRGGVQRELDQEDVRARGDLVCEFHVARRLPGRAHHPRVARVVRRHRP
jgi:hypothetical protein